MTAVREHARTALRWLLAAFFTMAGIGHFTETAFFVEIVPDYLPAPEALVYISGVAEIAGGIGLLIPRVRRAAGWGLLALLVAVFPANIDMAVNPKPLEHAPEWMSSDPTPAARWGRLPFQLVFAAGVWWVTLARRPEDGAPQ